ncbi:MAG: apolipoprotein N-acyltransferase [Deltaproteobacteria bacterium]|nr:apolipoprotein N-acyltransferase [Deltaproteobacteria bacterium]
MSVVATIAILASAALHALAFPPCGWWPLAFVALAPFFVVVTGVSPRRAALYGGLWGVAAHWAEAAWVLPAMRDYYQQPVALAVAFGLVSSLLFRGIPYALFGAAAAWLLRGRRGGGAAALLAALWVAFELLRARGPSADPWLLLGYALVPRPVLLQAADLGGIYLLSFVVALVNAALAQMALPVASARRQTRAAALMAAAAVLGLLLYGQWRLATVLPDGAPVPVAIVQGNNDLGAQWRVEHYGAGLDTYLDLSRQAVARGADLLVWPESAVTFFLAHEPQYLARIEAMLAERDTALVAGAPHFADPDPALPQYFNSAFAVGRDGIAARYDKQRLLPFAEYFPLRFVELLRRRFDRVRSFTAGGEAALLPTPLGPTAVVICFEAVFPELVRERMQAGATALLNLSNDAWLGTGSGPAQHFAMVVPRAVEERTWIVRATTTGISALIDPTGVVRASAPANAAALLSGDVVPGTTPTLYRRWGDWFAVACAALVGLVAAVQYLARPR